MNAKTVLALAPLLLLLVPAVNAHADYLSSEPSKGSRLDAPPTTVSVTLTEEIDPDGSGIDVVDRSGERVDDGHVEVQSGERPKLSVGLPADLPPGPYSIRWWALSSVDQHVTRGSVGFAVGAYEPPASGEGSSTSVPVVLARSAGFLGFALVLAALAFLAFDPTRGATWEQAFVRLHVLGWLVHAAGLLSLCYLNATDAQLTLNEYAQADVGRLMLARASIAVGGLVVALIAIPVRLRHPAGWTSLALLGLSAIGSARFGHSSQYGPLAILLDLVHYVATTGWIGGLVAFLLFLTLARRDHIPTSLVHLVAQRFSSAALLAVSVMAVTGVLLSILILQRSLLSPASVLSTTYGLALLGKIVLVLAMIGVAAINRYVVLADPSPTRFGRFAKSVATKVVPDDTQPLHEAEEPAGGKTGRLFSRLLGTEAAFGVTILLLAGLLTSVAPPTQAETASGELQLLGAGEEFAADLRIDPRPGTGVFSDLRVRLTNLSDDQPVVSNTCGREGCVVFNIALGDDPHEGGEVRIAQPEGDGWWRVDDFLWASAGDYALDIDVQTGDVFLDEIEFELTVE